MRLKSSYPEQYVPHFVPSMRDAKACKKRFTGKNLSGVQQAFLMEKKMGKGVERSEVLQ